MSLTINLITRSRPQRLLDTLARTAVNIRHCDTTLMVSIDDDDQETIDVIPKFPADSRVVACVAPREDALGSKYNRALRYPADVYLPMGDYAPHVTPGFDMKILEAASLFPDGIGVVLNHLCNLSFSGITAVTHKLTERMGFLYPPYFPYWFVDHWIEDIARLIDRISFADVHLNVGLKPKTQELREPAFWATFFDATHVMRRKCAEGIIRSDDFLESEWRKKTLLNLYPLIETRSLMINNFIRANSAEMERSCDSKPPDERYIRIRNNAMAMMATLIPDLEKEWAKAA